MNMRTRLALALVTCALSGCNSTDSKELKDDAGKLVKTAGRAVGNAQLAARVNGALVNRKGIDMSGLHVEAENGVVTLGGHVRNAKEKALVVETTEGVRGVQKVVNKLRIQKP